MAQWIATVSTVILTHQVRLVPNKEQERYFIRACGVARFAYNWALSEWERLYVAGERRCGLKLRRTLNAIKDERFPWMREVTKNAPQQAIKNLGRAYSMYYDNVVKAQRGEMPWARVGKPRFKRKGESDSFRADNGSSKDRPNAVRISGRRVKLPRVGWIRMREPLRFDGQIISATVLRRADRWFVSLAVRVSDPFPKRDDLGIVGCDLGITTFATMFDGSKSWPVNSPKPLRSFLRKVRRLSRSLSRKQKGSRNRARAKAKLARLYTRVADIRRDWLNKFTTQLTRSYRTLGVETLHIRAMQRNRRTALSVSDCAFGEFRRQLMYKSKIYGATIVLADRWFPSSKICSSCGHLNERVAWAVRTWRCPVCGAVHERDVNAAKNLYLAASSAVQACGAEGAGQPFKDWRNRPRRSRKAH